MHPCAESLFATVPTTSFSMHVPLGYSFDYGYSMLYFVESTLAKLVQVVPVVMVVNRVLAP